MKRIVLSAILVIAALPSSSAAYDLGPHLERVKEDLSKACSNAVTIALRLDGGALERAYSDDRAQRNAYEQVLIAFTLSEADQMSRDPAYRLAECERMAVDQRVGLLTLIEPKAN